MLFWVQVLPPTAAAPPCALILSPVQGAEYRENETVPLDATPSFDPDGDALSYRWESDKQGLLGEVPVLRVTLVPGKHRISLTVTDTSGESNTTWEEVTIRALHYPVPALSADKTVGTAMEPFTFYAENSTDQDGAVVAYSFDFGDGAATGWTDSSVASHQYLYAGTYTVTLKVRDNDGLVASTNLTVEVLPRVEPPPKPSPVNPYVLPLIAVLIVVIIIFFARKLRR